MNLDKVTAFVNVVNRRGSKALLMRRMYGAALTAPERDELLICRRIAERKAEKAKVRGAVCT